MSLSCLMLLFFLVCLFSDRLGGTISAYKIVPDEIDEIKVSSGNSL